MKPWWDKQTDWTAHTPSRAEITNASMSRGRLSFGKFFWQTQRRPICRPNFQLERRWHCLHHLPHVEKSTCVDWWENIPGWVRVAHHQHRSPLLITSQTAHRNAASLVLLQWVTDGWKISGSVETSQLACERCLYVHTCCWFIWLQIGCVWPQH